MKKSRKLLDKLAGILNAKRQAQQDKYKSLKKALKSVRSEKSRLKEQLMTTTDPGRKEEITLRLKVVSVQLKKGLRLLEKLTSERKE